MRWVCDECMTPVEPHNHRILGTSGLNSSKVWSTLLGAPSQNFSSPLHPSLALIFLCNLSGFFSHESTSCFAYSPVWRIWVAITSELTVEPHLVLASPVWFDTSLILLTTSQPFPPDLEPRLFIRPLWIMLINSTRCCWDGICWLTCIGMGHSMLYLRGMFLFLMQDSKRLSGCYDQI